MPSDALRVRPYKCDGCYRPEQDASGMWLLAAYTRQSSMVTRTVHGLTYGKGMFKGALLFSDHDDAVCYALRLNVRISG